MPLDPQARAVLDQLEAANMPDLASVEPAVIRQLTDASVDLSRSVSSIRSTNPPPLFLLNNQQNKAVLAPPTWRSPVGLGANRVFIIKFLGPLRSAVFYQNKINCIRHYALKITGLKLLL